MTKRKFALLYSWLIKSICFFIPDFPPLMRLRGVLYSLLMAHAGRNFQVAHSATLVCLESLEVGDDVYIANNAVLLCGGGITLGNRVMIAHNSVLSSSDHTIKDGSYRWGERELARVIVEDGAWVGANCTLIKGSRLPRSSVLAAGSVLTVTGDVADAIYAGVPAKIVKVGAGREES